jgi:uncharacterized protein
MNALSDAATRRVAVEGYRRCHTDAKIEVVPFRTGQIDAAIRLYEARSDKTWSLTDCLSFVVMEQRHLLEAPTADRHFEQAGLRAIMLDDPPV